MSHNDELINVIPRYCHIDGPHDRDTVLDAAGSIAELVRYLNHATQGPAAARTLEWANTIYETVSSLSAAVHGCDQLLGQLAAALERQAGDPKLYDDRRDRPGAGTAHAAATMLQAARAAVRETAGQLDAGRDLTVHLGNDD